MPNLAGKLMDKGDEEDKGDKSSSDFLVLVGLGKDKIEEEAKQA